MSVQVTMRMEAEMAVLALSGVADEALLVRLAGGVEAVVGDAAGRVVVELDELVLGDASAISAFVTRLQRVIAADRVTFACQRVTCRRLLRRVGGVRLSVVPSVGDASQLPPCRHREGGGDPVAGRRFDEPASAPA